MRKVGFIYDDIFLQHVPPVWHPDSGNRLTSIIAELKKTGIWYNSSYMIIHGGF